MTDLVTLTIDGRVVKVAPNTLLVEAAAQAGILVPVYCYHPKLAPVGACRMCLVEVEGIPKLIASCTTPVREGMVVSTNNARVEKARRGMLEFLLVHHPLDCPVCDKGGECPLQDYTYEFGPASSRFTYPKRHWEKPLQIGPNILLDRERCIMCFRCVRFCQEISGHEQIGVFNRGNGQEIGVHPGQPFDSQFSGNTIELCPVGALTGAPNRFFGRTWEVEHTPGVCTGCAAGCNIRIDTRDLSSVVRYWCRENRHTDGGWLCDGGRFSFGFINDDRLGDPQVRNGESLEDATWQQATVKAAAILSEHARAGTLGVLASPVLTNEDLWAVRTLAVEVIGAANLDYTPLRQDPALRDLSRAARKAGYAPGQLSDIDEAARILTIGVDLSKEQPVTELRVKKAVRQGGAQMVSMHTSEIELNQYSVAAFKYEPGRAATAVLELAEAIRRPGDGPEPLQCAARALAAGEETVVVLGAGLAESEDASLIDALDQLRVALGRTTPCIVVFPCCNTRGALDLGIVPGAGGMTGAEMMQAALEGRIKALYLAGVEPLLQLDSGMVREALGKLEALVFQGWSLRDLESVPDVVLAARTFAETDGTFTNTDGRIQRVFRAIRARGRSRTAWQIAADLAQALGKPWAAAEPEEIFEQIVHSVPAYSEVKWGKLGVTGVPTGTAPRVAEPAG